MNLLITFCGEGTSKRLASGRLTQEYAQLNGATAGKDRYWIPQIYVDFVLSDYEKITVLLFGD